MDHEQCGACGFDGGRYDDESLLAAVRALGPRWRVLIDRAGPEVRTRPAPAVWSAIEYAAHSRDITALHVFGIEQALTRDEPAFPAIEADDLIESAAIGYAESEPSAVVAELTEQSTRLAEVAAAAGPKTWTRGLTLGDERTDIRRLLEHALHDSEHHLDDVERGLAHLPNENKTTGADTGADDDHHRERRRGRSALLRRIRRA